MGRKKRDALQWERRGGREVARLLIRHPLAGFLAVMTMGSLLTLLAVGSAAAALVIPAAWLLGWG